MCKEGDRLVIEPTPPKSLLALLATLEPLDDEPPRFPSWTSIPSSSDAYLLDTNIRLGPRAQTRGAVDHSRSSEAGTNFFGRTPRAPLGAQEVPTPGWMGIDRREVG